MGFGVRGLRAGGLSFSFRVSVSGFSFGFRVSALEFDLTPKGFWVRLSAFEFRNSGSGGSVLIFWFRVPGFGFQVSGFGFRAPGSRFRGSGPFFGLRCRG